MRSRTPHTKGPARQLETSPPLPALVAGFLFFSGACALAYQLTWLRLLTLVFGHSTPASAPEASPAGGGGGR